MSKEKKKVPEQSRRPLFAQIAQPVYLALLKEHAAEMLKWPGRGTKVPTIAAIVERHLARGLGVKL